MGERARQVGDECLTRNRGLADLARCVGDVAADIRAGLAARSRVRVLDIGAGLCKALVELGLRFGDRVELHGLSRRAEDGDWPAIRASIIEHGVCTPDEIDRANRPVLHYADADEGLPFADASFDVVFSQSSILWFAQKARLAEEVNRVLAPGGIARLDMGVERKPLPAPYATSLIVVDGGREVSFWDYAARFPNLRAVRLPRSPWTLLRARLSGGAILPPRKERYLEVRKADPFSLGLRLIRAVDLHTIDDRWFGMQSTYEVGVASPSQVT